jgi:hypothetical protein
MGPSILGRKMDRPVTGFHAIISSMSLLLHKHSETLAIFETLPTIGCTQVKEMTDWKKNFTSSSICFHALASQI